jgi:hypothetical protein
MTDTIREKIITAFAERAKSLSTLPVERCRRSINDTNTRFVTLWDGAGQVREKTYSSQTMEFPIAVECVFTVPEKTNPSILANAIMGEIVKTQFTGDPRFGGLADSMAQQDENPSYQQDGTGKMYVIVTFLITYSTKAGDPYTAAI